MNHRTMIPRCILVLISLGILVSCSKSPAGPDGGTSGALIPLAVGNQWNYLTFSFDSLGSISSTSHDSTRIDGDSTIESQQWYYQRINGEKVAYRNTDQGVVTRLFDTIGDGRIVVNYRYPAHVGDSFGYPVFWIIGGTRIVTSDTDALCIVKSIDTTIGVPAGMYSCYLFRTIHHGSDAYSDEYISPFHGWIQTDFYSRRRPGGPLIIASSRRASSIVLR